MILVLAVACLVASTLTSALLSSATAVTAGTLTLAPTSAIAGEDVTAGGTLPTSDDRPVRLEKKVGTSWVLVDRATSTGASFQFLLEAPTATTIYRVHAPATDVGGTPLEDVVTPARTETILAQTATLSVPTSAVVGHDVTVTATFTPVRPDRGVRIQSFDGSSWVSVASGVEDATGKLVVDVPAGDSAGDLQLRARASYWQGAAAATSTTRTVHVTPPPPDTTPPGPVTGLSASEVGSDHITLSWTNPGDGDFAGVMIRRRLGTTPPGRTGGDLVAMPGPVTSYADYGVTSSTAYAYAVFAYDEVPNYSTGATATATTLRYDVDPPGPVTDLRQTAATTTTIDLSWTNPPDADFDGVEVRRALGTVAPVDRTVGTLVLDAGPGVATVHDTGLIAGRTYSYALFPHDDVDNFGSTATTSAATDSSGTPTTADWPQGRQGPEHRAWLPTETAIRPSTLPAFGEEWNTTATGTPVIGGGQLFTSGSADDGSAQVANYDLASGALQWTRDTGSCAGQLALTPTTFLVECGAIRAYARGGSHALLWDTTVTDPGQSFADLLVLGDTVVAWSSDRVAAYRMSDGQRIWQQLLPAGAGNVADVAASVDKVVVTYGNRLRALSLANGSQQWSQDVAAHDLVLADGWAYVQGDGSVSRYDLASGALGWTVNPENGVYRLFAADSGTVYVWTAVFDFGPPVPSILRALRTSDGGQRWAVDVPSRIGTVAVTGSLVWLTSSEIFSQGRSSDLIALNRADGGQLRRITFDDNMYAGQSRVAFGAGKVVFEQGGSAGYPAARLRVWGVAGARPDVTTRVLPMGRVGAPYSFQLGSAPAPGPITWSVAAGTLPAGITLSPGGLLSGTPSAAGQPQVTLRATSSNGRSHQVSVPLLVVPATSPANWVMGGQTRSRNAFSPGTGALDRSLVAGFAYRWQTAPTDTTYMSYGDNVVVYGSRFYTIAGDGRLRAYAVGGATVNRMPVWTTEPDDAALFSGQVAYDGGTLVGRSDDGRLWGVRASDGLKLWHTATSFASPYSAPLVVNGTVVSVADDGALHATSLADGSPRWAGTLTTRTGWGEMSTDGTRIYGMSDCVLYALSATDGSELWHTATQTSEADCSDNLYVQSAPIVNGGLVYASEPFSKLVARAATGVAITRFRSTNTYGANGVVVGGLWIYPDDDGSTITAQDVTTGRRAWHVPAPSPTGHVNLTATGDLLLVTNPTSIYGLDRLTGDLVWDGGTYDGFTDNEEAIAITGNRILVPTSTGVRAYGPL